MISIRNIFLLFCTCIGVAIIASYYQTEQKNEHLKSSIAQVQKELQEPPPPPIIRKKTIIIEPPARMIEKPAEANKNTEPHAPKPTPMPPPPKVVTITDVDNTPVEEYKRSQQIKIEIIGILKLQINENNSWETIAKLLVLILFSYGGIKFINRRFA